MAATTDIAQLVKMTDQDKNINERKLLKEHDQPEENTED